jgi:ABC-type nitrate/sulfonate/bicarbonate transport system substrate-binding protein
VPSAYSWTAIQKGAPIVTVLDANQDSGVIVVGPEIQQCSDLDGKKVAVPGLTSNRTLLFFKYIDENCPGADVEPIVIQSQTNQLMGVQTRQVEIALVQGSTFRKLQMSGPTDLHLLASFGKEFPGLGGSLYITRRDLVEQHPDVVRDLIRETLLARRSLQDPKVFADALVKYLKMDPSDAANMANSFYDQGLWNLNGGLNSANIKANLEFLLESDLLDPGLEPEDVVDASLLNSVLDEIGRR